jgi:hypothetical protein
MVRRDPQADPVEPASHGAAVEFIKLAVNHEHDLLAEIFDVRFGDAEAQEHPPQVRPMVVKHLRK